MAKKKMSKNPMKIAKAKSSKKIVGGKKGVKGKKATKVKKPMMGGNY